MATDPVRIATAEAIFRSVNERIAESARRFESPEAEFVCECGDRSCTHRVELAIEDYDRIRSDATRFLLVPGHEDRRVERVVRRRKGAAVVEKFERTVVETVRRLNPRPEAT